MEVGYIPGGDEGDASTGEEAAVAAAPNADVVTG